VETRSDPIACSVGAPIGLIEIPGGKRGLIRHRGKPLALMDSAYYIWLHGLPAPPLSYLEQQAGEILGKAGSERLHEMKEAGLMVTFVPNAEESPIDLDRLAATPLGMGLGRDATSEEFMIGDAACQPLVRIDGLSYSIWSDLIPGEVLSGVVARIAARFSISPAVAGARVAALVETLMRARLLTLDILTSPTHHDPGPSSAPKFRIKTRT